MAESTTTFGGFDAMSSIFTGSTDITNNEINVTSPEELKKQMESLDKDIEVETPETEEINKDPKTTNEKPKKEIEDESKEEVVTDEEDEQYEEVEYSEEELVDTFSDMFSDELGWDFEEGKKPKNVKDLIGYIQELIETNSAPNYSSDDIKSLDEFVRNGGDPKDFISKVWNTEVDPDKLDLTKEEHQKTIIRENLRNRGYSAARIDKLIDRYEESNSLEEEANESLDEVKEYKEKSKKQLLETRAKQAIEQKQQQQAFVQNVEKIIEDTNTIQGLQLSKKEKQTLKDYIFKPVSNDGMSKFQKDYNSNLKHLVTSAFLTMKGDNFQQQIQQKATTEATNKLRLKLKTKGKSTKNTISDNEVENTKGYKVWDVAQVLTSNK